MFVVVGREFLKVRLVFDESNDCKVLYGAAKGDVNCFEEFAGDSELDEYFIGDGDRGKVELFDVGCKISYLVDQLIGDVILVLEIKVLQSAVHYLQQVMLVDHSIGKFLYHNNYTFK